MSSPQPQAKPKFTSAQTWVLHSLDGLGIVALVTVAPIVLSAFQSGNLDLTKLGIAIGTAILGIFSRGIASILSNPQTLQAGEDTLADLRGGISALIMSNTSLATSHQSLLSMFGAFLQANTATNVLQSPGAPLAPAQTVGQPPVPIQVPTPATAPTNTYPVQQVPFPALPPAQFAQSMQMPAVSPPQ